MSRNKQAENPNLPERFTITTEERILLDQCRESEERINRVHFRAVNAQEEDFSGLSFSQVKFECCSFTGCSFEKAEFSDAEFLSCNFSNCNFSDSYWRRALLRSSKLTGAKLTGSSLRDVRFTDCNMKYANLNESKLELFCAENSDFGNSDLARCKCKHVTWDHATLQNVSFFKTPLKGMDFTTSNIQGLVLSDECTEVRGAVMDLYQAAELAARLGVIIK